LEEFKTEFKSTNCLSDRYRIWFFELWKAVSALEVIGICHRDIKATNILMRKNWPQGSRGDPMLVLADLGISLLDSPYRTYGKLSSSSSSMMPPPARQLASEGTRRASQRAITIHEKAVVLKRPTSSSHIISPPSPGPNLKPLTPNQPTIMIEGVDIPSLQATMMTAPGDPRYHTLSYLSGGSHGYRPPPLVEHELQERKIDSGAREINRLRAIEHGHRHDVFSAIAMMMDVIRPMDSLPFSKSKDPSAEWEKNVHRIGEEESTVSIQNFLLDQKSPPAQPRVMDSLCKLLVKGLKAIPSERISAKEGTKNDFFMFAILSQGEEALASTGGILVEGGITDFFEERLRPLRLIRGSHGLGVVTVEQYEEGDILTFYSGKTLYGAKDIISKGVLSLVIGDLYLDSAVTGEWPLSRYVEEKSVGGFLDSSRELARVKKKGNCFVDLKRKFQDKAGQWKVPVKTTCRIAPGSLATWCYDFEAGHSGPLQSEAE
jgi:serine/threonine protein kinase